MPSNPEKKFPVKSAAAAFFAFYILAAASPPAAFCGRTGISISGAWALYPVAVKWRQEYLKTAPGVRIEISAGGAGKGIVDVLSGMTDLAMVSREIRPEETSGGARAVAVCRDAVVGIVNAKHSKAASLLSGGMSRAAMAGVWAGKRDSGNSWIIPGANPKERFTVYTRSDSCGAADVWAGYLGVKQEDLSGVGVYGDPGMVAAVKNDPLGTGYCNLNFAYGSDGAPVGGIAVIPIDKNSDGRIGEKEDFYSTRAQFLRALSAGGYPPALVRRLYFVTKGKTKNPEAVKFLKWVLAQGQNYLEEAGYLPLPRDEAAAALKKIEADEK